MKHIFAGKTVWISGHTGFKGAWLTEWLLLLGARVHGFSLPAPTNPSLFEGLRLKQRSGLRHQIGDIRDLHAVRASIAAAQPDYVFHLAAQPLVRESYATPVETYATNVQGTVHVLESLRQLTHPCAAVFVTTDKCYENREWVFGYREEDPLGGYDPYSSSKAAAELVIQAYRRSFFQNSPVRIASARAGNVIGGGDWAADRIVPDCVRHLSSGRPIPVRNPEATRPWQHVLEPLAGYLWLAAVLSGNGIVLPHPSLAASAFNFGPGPESNRTVAELVSEMLRHWPGTWIDQRNPHAVHEAGLLQLSTDKARHMLKWEPVWNFSETIAHTIEWYRASQAADAEKLRITTVSQIESYQQRAAEKQIAWAQKPAADKVQSLNACAA